ncbi:uncharacterized protein PFL1_03035 [Pseudozyma flocculosa PF-1]|uniref:Related to 2-keto-4-pentenoate hydratase/2-oxohepta-3-ene-1,7-dioic acid hydratase (Catechol pathway) n=2 Tax=Pseudozyma flocculosa TaxID=84751 RepID=A0A5C3F023_9BASI|nr:uncharacterized protein PFL1_03035 [Pseudozyma flocculosa PF-1]EPQ29280.1 hypothetical protein PFL1_03035 [Pseudozyma flocculosa PF-1]SPO37788.1 related to 2-keto-4-pentenoate hydratase/2-oxohepta-3-ene-1,7-dioic acid hydratase (catechol pathway) [Pseudozyma flocculosa]
MMQTSWHRLIRFIAAQDGREHYGQPVDDDLDVGQAYHERASIRVRPLVGSPFSASATLSPDVVLTVQTLLCPLPPNEVRTIRGLGANFIQPGQDRIDALSKRTPIPIVFYKPLTTISSPSTPIVIPPCAADESDYEAELVVVVSRTCKDVSPANALQHVLGYTLSNDVTARSRMKAASQWGLCKSFDTWFPFGPVLVSASHRLGISNPDNVHLQLHLNGNLLQDGNTADMLWKVAETVSELSKGTTLEAGSLISMGTPPGEGFKRSPPVFLRDGDLAVVKGSNGLGSLINPVQAQIQPALPKPRL